MPNHDYTAKEALDLLIRKIEDVSPALAHQIRSAIDAGKDIQAEENPSPARDRKGTKKRYYRKHIAYTDEEALEVAMAVLESHLIESRMLVNAAHEDFKQVGLTTPKKRRPLSQSSQIVQPALALDMELTDEATDVSGVEHPKEIVIESEPEAVQEKKNLPDVRFEPIDEQQLRSLRELFEALRPLTNFKGANDGNTH